MKVFLKKYWSYIINLILLIIVLLSLVPEDKPKEIDLSIYTQNDLTKSVSIQKGMDTDDVLKIMGKPVLKEISGDSEEYHYCSTGKVVDEFISIKFSNGKVLAMSYYVVNALDVAFNHTPTPNEKMLDLTNFGDCRLTIRWGSYDKRNPNVNTYHLEKNNVSK